MYVRWQNIIDKCGLYWQYPVCTEKQFYLQNKAYGDYIGFPWATIIDKGGNLTEVIKFIGSLIHPEIEYYTCCQHIRFRELKPVFDLLNIKTVYTPHKVRGEDWLGAIRLKPCPLYAVNYEDPDRNAEFLDQDFLSINRKYLFSFVGGLQPGYISDVRDRLFSLDVPDNCVVQNSGEWHFNEIVYTEKQNSRQEFTTSDNHQQTTTGYNHILLNSKFSLCPSGTGPNSIRFWESLASATIPVLLSDTLELPPHDLWEKAVVFIKEADVENVERILSVISPQEQYLRRENCKRIYNHFKNNYTNHKKRIIVHYCCGSYYNNNFGGVACYDYQLSKIISHRVFFEAPAQKQELLDFLGENPYALVITDNHLSIDIPNQYETLVVHHGVAMTHAIRDPNWDLYWRMLCCNGQNKMLAYRDPKTTKFVSCSTFCVEEFLKHYGEEYNKYDRVQILHTSEFDEKLVKTNWNKTPLIIGNWATLNKGQGVVERIKSLERPFVFQTLFSPLHGNIRKFIEDKQKQYVGADIFLQLSLSEGNSYATLDAMQCGLVVVSTDVGLFYKDVPEDCYVRVDWKRHNDVEYILSKIEYAWKHREQISKKARSWYMEHCSNDMWQTQIDHLVGYNRQHAI